MVGMVHIFGRNDFEQIGFDSSGVSPLDRPRRRETRNTCCVDRHGRLAVNDVHTTFAVLRPTPGSLTISSMVDGTLPP